MLLLSLNKFQIVLTCGEDFYKPKFCNISVNSNKDNSKSIIKWNVSKNK